MPQLREDTQTTIELLEDMRDDITDKENIDHLLNTLKSPFFKSLMLIQDKYAADVPRQSRPAVPSVAALKFQAAASPTLGRRGSQKVRLSMETKKAEEDRAAKAEKETTDEKESDTNAEGEAPSPEIVAVPIATTADEKEADIQDEKKNDTELEPIRHITLIKGDTGGLGFNIVGGSDQQTDVFVSRIVEGGVAEKAGTLKQGDKIIEVNGSSLANVTHVVATDTLKRCSGEVNLVVRYDPEVVRLITPLISKRTDVIEPQKEVAEEVTEETAETTETPCTPNAPLDSENANNVRGITLKKESKGLGFNIVGGKNHESGVFVSRIFPGGVADLDGRLKKSDQITKVNNNSLLGLTHEEAASLLKCAQGSVELTVQTNLEGFAAFVAMAEEKKEGIDKWGSAATTKSKVPYHIRALFDFDDMDNDLASNEGLSFTRGTVLKITSDDDINWWKATNVETGKSGLIPSMLKQEKREFAKQKSVKFEPAVTSPPTSPTLKRIKGSFRGSFRRSKKNTIDRKGSVKYDKKDDAQTVDLNVEHLPVYTYEYVVKSTEGPKKNRPVVILGPSKEIILEKLLTDYPDKFMMCVPHTTRPIREGEKNGREYFFISKDAMDADIKADRFVEAGQFNGNLYGTAISSILDVAREERHCVLDVGGHAIKNMKNAKLDPVVIYIKSTSIASLKAQLPELNDDEANSMMEKASQMEMLYSHLFDSVIENNEQGCKDIDRGQKNTVEMILDSIETLSTGDRWVREG